MANNPVIQLKDYAQSVWIDYLERGMLEGELQEQIETRGLRGMTSNPRIYAKAIPNNEIYNPEIEAGNKNGKSVKEIYESIIFEDIRKACDIFRPIYEESGGIDGYVSIEVSPELAEDAEGTFQEAQRYFQAVDRENVMIKIHGTPEGLVAVEKAIAEGINVNVTLLFSLEHYVETAQAYIRGLEKRAAAGKAIDKIASVASIFLSRIDKKVDRIIDEKLETIGTETLNEEARLNEIKGKVAIANAKVAYQKYKEIFSGDRWQALADKGAKVQRLLWASTSTKNPEYSDVMYVNELVAPNTVTTLPPKTIEACADHCDIAPNRIETGVEEAYSLLDSLKEPDIAIDLDRVMDELLQEGVEKYAEPYEFLLDYLKNPEEQQAEGRKAKAMQSE